LPDNLYEGMFLLDSDRFTANPVGAQSELIGILEKAGAEVVANRPWLDGKLAYPIEGRRKGLHYLTYFRMEGNGISQVNQSCKLNESVLRHLIIKHPPSIFEAMVGALNGNDSEPQAVAKTPPTTEGVAQTKGTTEGVAQTKGTTEGVAQTKDTTEGVAQTKDTTEGVAQTKDTPDS